MSNNFLTTEWIVESLSDLWSLYLAMIGCLVSVFTLLYSFIISKKGELKMFTEQLNHGDKSPTIVQRQRFAMSYIKRMNKALELCLILLIGCIFLATGSWVGLRILNEKAQKLTLYIVAVLPFFVLVLMIILCVKVYKQYKKDVKI